MTTIQPREVVLIPNTAIKSAGITFLELNSLLLKQFPCELGSPQKPSESDWKPAFRVAPETLERVARYKQTILTEQAALVYNLRVDVAGNLVGLLLPQGPKSDKILKQFAKPKCGVVVQPRIGHVYAGLNGREVKVFGFDVGFK